MTCNNANVTGGQVNLSSSGQNDTRISVYEGSNSNNKAGIESARVYLQRYGTFYAYMAITEYVDTGVNGGIIDLSDTSGNDTFMEASGITTPKLTQTSTIEKKKNIEKLNKKAIELIKNSDICTYNFKTEKDKNKKHIGLVIGGEYKCADEVISEDREGIEQYSMISLAWKAIQELAQENENLKQRIEKLEAK